MAVRTCRAVASSNGAGIRESRGQCRMCGNISLSRCRSIYVTWVCSIGSAIVGNKIWYLYLFVPAFGLWKLYSAFAPFINQFLAARRSGKTTEQARQAGAQAQQEAGGVPGMPESKRQQKLRARMERGDKRIRQVERKVAQ